MAGIPRSKDGELKCQWGKLVDCAPDIVICRGEGVPKTDGHLLHHVISSKDYSPFNKTWHPSFIEELELRGYDIKTLKISVRKKTEGDN